MNKQFLLTLIVALSLFLSVSAVCASEINVTDSYAASLVDDTSDVSVYNYAAGSDISVSSDSNVGNDSSKVSLSSDEVLESEDSNTLSTNTDSNKLTINEQNAESDGVAFSDDTQSSLGANNKKDVYFRSAERTLHVEDIYNGYDYEVYLRDSDGNPLANKQVTLTFNGKKQTLKTNSRGRVDFNISVQKAGTYKVSLDFAGDDDYNALSCPDFRTVKVIKWNVTFVAPNKNLHVEDIYDGYSYGVTLRDSEGNALANQKVTITFNGVNQTKTTNANGRVYFNISVEKAGTYNVSLKFAGTRYYYSLTCPDFRTITVVKWNVSFVAPNKNFHVEDIYDGYSYGVTLRDSNGNPLANQKVTITFNGVNQTKTTNANGRVYFNISVEKAGTYNVSLKFAGTRYYYSLTCPDFRTITVVKWNTTLKAKDMYLKLKDISNGFIYQVFLMDSQGNALANKQITLTFNGKEYVNRTDSEGYCYFNLTVDDVGEYPVNIKFDGTRYYYSKSSSKTVVVTGVMKNVSFVAPNKKLHVDEISSGYSYGVTLRDTNGNPLANKNVTITFNGKKQTKTTNANGRVYFNLTADKVGTYGVSLDFAGDKWYNPLSCPNFRTITVFGNNTKLTWKSESSFESGSQTFKVLLTDSNGVALANQIVKLTVNSKTYSEKTASNGYATFSLSLNANTYNVSYKYEGDDRYNPSSGSKKITVKSSSISVSINNILTASVTVKEYYAKYYKLPSTVTISGTDFTMPEFLYLMSQAICQLGKSNSNSISSIKGVKSPSSISGDRINAQLLKADYLTVAKNVVDYIKSNNRAPGYVSSAVGKINFTELVEASARILAFYKNNDKYMPNYVTISCGSSHDGSLNVVNTITDLSPYYKATKNCQVNNSQIKAVVDSLIKGLTTAEQKAIAIYNYVRDQISYSFYYDTQYGAVGTLNAKTGNCVDQAHLLIAMYRTAGLAARYEHGTCYFTLSGSTYGHVWAQVLIDGVWVVADPTSNRNSFGKVVNWNTNSYTHKAYYASLPF